MGNRRLGGMVALWLVVCVGGLSSLWRYEASAGDAGAPPPQWPASAQIVRTPDKPSLLVFAHPHCPCTRATLSELAELVRAVTGGPQIVVVFSVPDGVEASWENGELLDRARAMAGVEVIVDRGGAIGARVFRVRVSGHALVYDAGGSLRYSGGLTAARGHVGDNLGRRSALAALADTSPDARYRRVFGCGLENPR